MRSFDCPRHPTQATRSQGTTPPSEGGTSFFHLFGGSRIVLFAIRDQQSVAFAKFPEVDDFEQRRVARWVRAVYAQEIITCVWGPAECGVFFERNLSSLSTHYGRYGIIRKFSRSIVGVIVVEAINTVVTRVVSLTLRRDPFGLGIFFAFLFLFEQRVVLVSNLDLVSASSEVDSCDCFGEQLCIRHHPE